MTSRRAFEFFKTLPSLDDPFQLRDPTLSVTTDVNVDTWLDSVQQQVITQHLKLKDNPDLNGFSAAFTSPMDDHGWRQDLLDLYLRNAVQWRGDG